MRLSAIAGQFETNKTASAGDIFGHLEMAPPDPILGTAQAYKADTSKDKMNLGVGAYRDDNEKPYPFKAVMKVEKEILEAKMDKEYLPIDGHAEFRKLAQELLFGKEHPLVKEGKITTVQALSGTGALRVGFEFLKLFLTADVYVPNPTWVTHCSIINKAGLQWKYYPYYKPSTRGFDFEGMIKFLNTINPGSIVLLHACAHNPTGVDPTLDQWRQIAAVMKERRLFPFFDSAYQGFASGDLIKDASAIRLFVDMGFQMVVSQSFAKNMGLYGERVGALHIVCQQKQVAEKVLSQLCLIIRPNYSNPPLHGARIAIKILGNPQNFEEWRNELYQVSQRIIQMRKLLRENLEKLQVPGKWDHITTQIGMFSYTGLTPEQCDVLIKKWHIYLLRNGRISMCGITTKNVEYLARAIQDAIVSTKKQFD